MWYRSRATYQANQLAASAIPAMTISYDSTRGGCSRGAEYAGFMTRSPRLHDRQVALSAYLTMTHALPALLLTLAEMRSLLSVVLEPAEIQRCSSRWRPNIRQRAEHEAPSPGLRVRRHQSSLRCS